MSIWQFNRGNWESIPDSFTPESEGQSEDEAMVAAGWHRYNLICTEHRGTMEVWQKVDTFYLVLSTVDVCESVLCPDLPSYLMFVKEFAVPFMTLEKLASKTSAAWDAEERREKMRARSAERSFDRSGLSYLKK